MSLLHTPNNQPKRFPSAISTLEFLPARERPAIWRQIEVEVHPEQIRAFWRALDINDLQEFRRSKGRFIIPMEYYANLPPNTDPRITVPPWSPRMAFGIYTCACAVAIKNITIIPLPKPKE